MTTNDQRPQERAHPDITGRAATPALPSPFPRSDSPSSGHGDRESETFPTPPFTQEPLEFQILEPVEYAAQGPGDVVRHPRIADRHGSRAAHSRASACQAVAHGRDEAVRTGVAVADHAVGGVREAHAELIVAEGELAADAVVWTQVDTPGLVRPLS